MHLHVQLSPSRLHRHPLAAVGARQVAQRSAVVLLAAYGFSCMVWGFSDSGAPDLLVSLGLYALAGAMAAQLAPQPTGVVLTISALVGPPIALAARWLGQTYATTLHDGQLAALFAVPFAAGVLLLAAGARRRQRDRGARPGN